MAKEVTSKEENYSQWYNNLVVKADLAENSAVRGCMVIKPYGYAIWEKIQGQLDRMFKATGHQNAYFPLFIPKSFLSREAEHVEGFAKECAVVTHHRLKANPDGPGVVVDPDARLEEELIVRPTSETIIWNSYKNWIKSYRDLPILINQWANVVRWEMRTRLFLRTAEFLWQEGHTAHPTAQEAMEEAQRMVQVYADFARTHMALPVVVGHKSEHERFAGALDTLCVSTRLMGALIMAHGDNNGLVLPPAIAPIQVVFVPIYKGQEELDRMVAYMKDIASELEKAGISTKIDDRDNVRSGFKFAEWELKGVPVRVVIGPRDLERGEVEICRRDTLEKSAASREGLAGHIKGLLDDIQANIYNKALAFRDSRTVKVDTWDEFKERIEEGGFLLCHWDGTTETEMKIQEETKATIRCIPIDSYVCEEPGKCVYSGRPSLRRVIFARSY